MKEIDLNRKIFLKYSLLYIFILSLSILQGKKYGSIVTLFRDKEITLNSSGYVEVLISIIIFILLMQVEAIFWYFLLTFKNKVVQSRILVERQNLIKHIVNNVEHFIDKYQSVTLKKRIIEDIDIIENYIFSKKIEIPIKSVVFVIYFIILMQLNIYYCILCAFYILIGFYSNKWKINKLNPLIKEDYILSEQMEEITRETYRSWKVIKSLNAEKTFSERFKKVIKNYGNFRKRYNRMNYINLFLTSFQNKVLQEISVYLMGVYLIFIGKLNFVNLIFCTEIFKRIYSLILSFEKINTGKAKFDNASQRINSLFTIKGQTKQNFEQMISTYNVNNFKVSIDSKHYLDETSITFNSGKLYAIVGKSGSGKSALLDRISLVKQIEGIVSVNEKFQNSEYSFRNKICYLRQRPIMLNATIYENITFINNEVTKEQVINQLRNTKIYQWILNRFGSLDYEVMDNGVNLSGGEKKMISLIRAILFRPSILIIDELTEGLNENNKKIVMNVLKTMAEQGAIIIFATHDISLLNDFNYVLTLENKRITIQDKKVD